MACLDVSVRILMSIRRSATDCRSPMGTFPPRDDFEKAWLYVSMVRKKQGKEDLQVQHRRSLAVCLHPWLRQEQLKDVSWSLKISFIKDTYLTSQSFQRRLVRLVPGDKERSLLVNEDLYTLTEVSLIPQDNQGRLTLI